MDGKAKRTKGAKAVDKSKRSEKEKEIINT